MKTDSEIKERIEHIKTFGNGYGINDRRIKELEWVLKDSKLAMCEANSNALLDDVRADLRRMIDDASEDFRYNDSGGIVLKLKNLENKLKKISEHFS